MQGARFRAGARYARDDATTAEVVERTGGKRCKAGSEVPGAQPGGRFRKGPAPFSSSPAQAPRCAFPGTLHYAPVRCCMILAQG